MAVERKVCAKCGESRLATWYVSERGRVCKACRAATTKAGHRKHRLAEYDLTPAEYDAILAAQGGTCVCGRAQRGKRSLEVDHDHALIRAGYPIKQTIRGILCRACNGKILPYAKNNPSTLRILAEYLDDPPARKVLNELQGR